jgi:hypothetical protein
MATVNLVSGTVMDFAAARLNDASRQIYTYAVQLPFLNIALYELQEIYEANNIPVTDTTSVVIDVDAASAGFVEISFDDGVASAPFLPDDLIEIKVAWESPRDLNQWTPMTRLDFLPQYQIGAQINQFVYYQWATNQMKMLAANADNDIKLDYIRSLFIEIEDESTDLLVQNSISFLGNRTASLIASDIEENTERSQRLYGDALGGLDRALTIPTKGRQRITIRRKPFRAGYKASRSM